MGLLFVTTTAAEQGLLGEPAVEPNPRTVPTPASGRLPSSPPPPPVVSGVTEGSTTCSVCLAGPLAPYPDSGSGEIVCTWCRIVDDHGRAESVLRSDLAHVRTDSLVHPLPQELEGSTCRSCLGGSVVPDPDSGALVCTSCGLVHDLGAAEFVHRFDFADAPRSASLVHHVEHEEEDDDDDEAAEDEEEESDDR